MKSIFQTPEWEQLKLQTGYQKSYWLDDILVLQKNLPLGRSMLYAPMISENQDKNHKPKVIIENPAENTSIAELSTDFLIQLAEIGKDNKTIFCRLEFDINNTEGLILGTNLPYKECRKSFEEMQPEHTLILDISKTKEEILAQMKPKGRYNIKVAEKNAVSIECVSTKGTLLDNFYDLYKQTGSRHAITSRNKKYFETLLDILGEKGYARVYNAFAMIEGKKTPLAAAIILFHEGRATYLYGGSSNQYKNMMAPYLLHSKVIDDAKTENCTSYDFFGIAPDDDPKHPWSGVTRFKKQFGGEQVNLMGSYDLIFKPVEYEVFKLAEKIRRR